MTQLYAERRLHALGSACRIVIGRGEWHRHDMLDMACNELARLEAKIISFVPGSIINNLNEGAGIGGYTPLDAESRSLFSYVKALWEQSNHLFDPSTELLLAG